MVFNLKTWIKDANPSTLGHQMKLISAILKNRGRNSIFRPNGLKPRVHRLTGDRALQHHQSTGGVQSGRPDRSTDQANAIRSTGEEHQCEKTHKISLKTCKSSPKSRYLKGQPLDPVLGTKSSPKNPRSPISILVLLKIHQNSF
ncbi:hypothetical protein L484_022399 [Morus notabilis]|uniref:Uncharacterized protein n=1 Tax=Morus notabilis TaxID=981085 RepID=W9R3I1_9ROSA|nr:hypothetical protein L484_022399 [Morus notabilis]